MSFSQGQEEMREKMRQHDRQKGFSLIELMVGVTIGLLAIYASYRIFGEVEKNYRANETVNEAQMAGLYATFAVNQELNNAGAEVMGNFDLLQVCTAVTNFPSDGTGNPPFPLYPLPAAIIPTANSEADDLFVFYGTGSISDLPMFVSAVNASQNIFSLEAPLGLAANTVLVATARGNCEALVAQTITAPNGNGVVNITVGGGQALTNLNPGDALVNLGDVARRRFFVDAAGSLQMEIWQVNAAAGNNNWRVTSVAPIAANVVAFKAQYGIAATPGGPVDTWQTPDTTTVGQIISGGISVRDIKAIRFGLIVRAAEPDTALAGKPGYTETFFADCPSGGTCADPHQINLVVSQDGQPYGWRYRKYETTVPLQNTIWNR